MGRIYSNSPISSSVCAYFERENIVFCPTTIILIIIAPIFHKLLKKIGCGWGERPSVSDHLDVKEMSVSNILGALTH